MLKIDFYKNKREGDVNKGKVYGRVKNAKPIGLDRLAEHMAAHQTPFSPGTIKGIMTDMVHCIKELALLGQPIKIDELCIISAQVQSTPANDVDSFNLDDNIKVARLRFQATGTCTTKEVTREVLLGYTALAQRVKAGEITLSNEKGKYIATD